MKGTTDKEYLKCVEKARRQRGKMRLLLDKIDEQRDLIFKETNTVPAG